MSQQSKRIGFIGLGVMGEPICRNLAVKSEAEVVAFDINPNPVQRLASVNVRNGCSSRGVMEGSDVVFVSLPSGEMVDELAHAAGGLLSAVRPGQIVVDLSTSAVDTTRRLARQFAEREAVFIDAPVARTRAAAEAGTLSVMVGADPSIFERVRPLIATFATEITLCGTVGCGQVVKILNNTILFQIVLAISEAKIIGERQGVDPSVLFNTLAKGSADSFALRNHGMKAVLTKDFPARAFSVQYALKDLDYGLRLANEAGVDAQSARIVAGLFNKAIASGFGEQYWPVISRLIGS